MYDAGKIVPGLAVFVLLAVAPLLYNSVSGRGPGQPAVAKASGTQCVEPVEYMRSSHMELLQSWREDVVRNGKRTYTASDGKQYEISLVGTCMSCHTSKKEFCDTCHDYAGVSPNCWDCHVAPEVR